MIKNKQTLEKLAYFQSFDSIDVFYDGGQPVVANALHEVLGSAFAHNVVSYHYSTYRTSRLTQVADYLCAIELAALKYSRSEETRTDVRFFGEIGAFKRNYLKQARRKLLG